MLLTFHCSGTHDWGHNSHEYNFSAELANVTMDTAHGKYDWKSSAAPKEMLAVDVCNCFQTYKYSLPNLGTFIG